MPALLATVGPSDAVAVSNDKHITQADDVSDRTGAPSSNNDNEYSKTDDAQKKEEALSGKVMSETLDFGDIMNERKNSEHRSNDCILYIFITP